MLFACGEITLMVRENTSKSVNKVSIYFIWRYGIYASIVTILILLVGNRNLTGTDTSNYFTAYYNSNLFNYFEPFYTGMQNFFLAYGIRFGIFQVIIGALSLIILLVAYNIASKRIFFMIWLAYGPFQYFVFFNIMRQGISLSFMTLAFVLIYSISSKWKYIFSAILFFTAYQFHHSAIFGFILFMLVEVSSILFKKNIKWIAMIFSAFGIIGFRLVLSQFANIASWFGVSYFQNYMNTSYLQQRFDWYGWLNFILILLLIFIIKIDDIWSFSLLSRKIYIMSLMYLLLLSFMGNAQFITRISYYITFLFPILFVQALDSAKQSSVRKWIILLIILFYTGINFYISVQTGANGINPYQGHIFKFSNI